MQTQTHEEVLSAAYRDYFNEVMKPNIAYRMNLYQKMNEREDVCIVVREMCKRDFVWFCNNFIWVHEPRKMYLDWYGWPDPKLPFILYPFQEEQARNIIDCINSGRDILVEKSRDMGATWLVVSILFWMWMFGGAGNDFLLGSRKLEYVDKKGATDTLFEKIRYNLYMINPALFPNDFDPSKHDLVGFLVNPETGSYFRGEANNANFATSGRYKAIFADEYSKWMETDEQAYTSMGDSTRCRILVSTPWGMGRKFAQLRFSDAIDVVTLHWSDHPLKNVGMFEGQHPYFADKVNVKLSPWYLMECERRKDDPAANIGQELDIDYLSSGTPYFNNLKIQELHIELEKNLPEGIVRYEFSRTEDNVQVYEAGNGRIHVLEKPDQGWKNRYCIGADVAEGLEKGDNSVFYVYDRVDGKDVAWFAGKVDTTILAYLLSYFGYWYTEAYIGVEMNSAGHATIGTLKTCYRNIYHTEDFSKFVDIPTARLGWHTNIKTRRQLTESVREMINLENPGVFDLQFYKECMTFIHNQKGKAEADAGCLDDRIFAQGVKLMVHQWMPSPKKIDRSYDRFANKHQFGRQPERSGDLRRIWT